MVHSIRLVSTSPTFSGPVHVSTAMAVLQGFDRSRFRDSHRFGAQPLLHQHFSQLGEISAQQVTLTVKGARSFVIIQSALNHIRKLSGWTCVVFIFYY